MNFDPASQDDMYSAETYSDGCSFCDQGHDDQFEYEPGAVIEIENGYIDYSPPMSLVEATVVDAIVMGSGGPENGPITDAGLRFVRHIISQSRASNAGFLPNLKDMNCIKGLAKGYINQCGGGAGALETMYTVMHLQ